MTRKAMYTRLAAFSSAMALLFALPFADTVLMNNAAMAAEAVPQAEEEETGIIAQAAEETEALPVPAEEVPAAAGAAEETAPQAAEEPARVDSSETAPAPAAKESPEESGTAVSVSKEDPAVIEDGDAGHVSEALTEPFDRPEHSGEAAFAGTAEIRLLNEGVLHYGDEITLKAEVRDANMNYRLVWEASDNDGYGWYTVGSGEQYSFFLSRENAAREYRVSVIAAD